MCPALYHSTLFWHVFCLYRTTSPRILYVHIFCLCGTTNILYLHSICLYATKFQHILFAFLLFLGIQILRQYNCISSVSVEIQVPVNYLWLSPVLVELKQTQPLMNSPQLLIFNPEKCIKFHTLFVSITGSLYPDHFCAHDEHTLGCSIWKCTEHNLAEPWGGTHLVLFTAFTDI